MNNRWQTKTLGEVLERTETVNPLQSPNTEFDYIDVSSVSNTTFQIEETQRLRGKDAPSRARKVVRKNDIIFATIRPTLQRIAVVPEHLDRQVCSTGYFVLRTKPGIDHRFIFYSLFTEDFAGRMQTLQKGASYPAVTDAEVRAQTITFPPLSEQQRIVGLLDEAFEGIATAKANAEKNLQNARALFESALTIAMNGRLTEKWRKLNPNVETGSTLLGRVLAKRRREWSKKGEYPEPTSAAIKGRTPIPASWSWANLSQLKTFSLYGPRFSKEDYSQSGVLVLRTSDIDENGKVNSDTAPKLQLTEQDFDKYRCQKGDLLITRTGSLGTLAIGHFQKWHVLKAGYPKGTFGTRIGCWPARLNGAVAG